MAYSENLGKQKPCGLLNGVCSRNLETALPCSFGPVIDGRAWSQGSREEQIEILNIISG